MVAKDLLNPYVLAYLSVVVLSQLLLSIRGSWKRGKTARARRKQGLPESIIMNYSAQLKEEKRESVTQAVTLLAAVILTPFLLVLRAEEGHKNGLAVMFIGLLVWVAVTGTDMARAFLGGLALKTLLAIKHPIQVGDRVTIKGQSGKITGIGIFFVTLLTADDDAVNIPTRSLWGENLVSSNSGDRSSLCVMKFYLASNTTAEQRQMAEDGIWTAIQASVYLEASKPMQIFYSQMPVAICLTAKAYVTSPYDAPLFESDVTRAFLNRAAEQSIPLADPT